MRKLFALLAIVCAASAMAANAPAWYCDFENSEGYQTGKVVGQCGWYKASGTKTARDVVVNDRDKAASGDQYLSYDPSVSDSGKIAAVKFDISSQYQAVPQGKIFVSWDQARMSDDYRGDTCYFILYNFGDTGRSVDIEIARFKMEYYYMGLTATDRNGTSQKNVTISSGWEGSVTNWHHCTMLLDPENRMIKEFTIDNKVIDECTDLYYKNNSDSQPRGGDLIDGVGIMNKGNYDNIKVEVVPEPGFFGLLAFLSLFFARKQR